MLRCVLSNSLCYARSPACWERRAVVKWNIDSEIGDGELQALILPVARGLAAWCWLQSEVLSGVHVSAQCCAVVPGHLLQPSSFFPTVQGVWAWHHLVVPPPWWENPVLYSAAVTSAMDELHVFSLLENIFFQYNSHLKCHWLFFPLSRLTALPWKPLLEEKTFLLVTPETVWCFWKQSSAPAGYFHFHQHGHGHTSF